MYEKILIRIKLIYHNLNVGIIDNSGNHTHSQALLVSNSVTSSHQMPNYCVWIDGIWSIINCIYYKTRLQLAYENLYQSKIATHQQLHWMSIYYQQEQKLFWRHALFHSCLSVNSGRALKWYILYSVITVSYLTFWW